MSPGLGCPYICGSLAYGLYGSLGGIAGEFGFANCERVSGECGVVGHGGVSSDGNDAKADAELVLRGSDMESVVKSRCQVEVLLPVNPVCACKHLPQ
jgi:hypothetical protein